MEIGEPESGCTYSDQIWVGKGPRIILLNKVAAAARFPWQTQTFAACTHVLLKHEDHAELSSKPVRNCTLLLQTHV